MTLKIEKPTWLVSNGQSDESLIVSSTRNYDQFSFDPINRPIDQKHVDELVEAIKEKNLLREYPIVVDVNFKIIDGQHRLRAAQALGIPLFFIVSKEMTNKDVAGTNKRQKDWKTENYLHHWCAQGNPHYLALREFNNNYPFLSTSMCRFLLSGNIQRSNGVFDSGEFTITRTELAEQVVKCLLGFKKYTNLITKFQFVNAVTSMVANPKYDHRRMMQKLEYLSGHLHRCVDAAEYLSMLSTIYNYKVKDSDKVAFKSMSHRSRTPGAKE